MSQYMVYYSGFFEMLDLRDIVDFRHTTDMLWSARLSTGLFGRTDCHAGNRGPKNINEVFLSVGDEGLQTLIELGFITCPSCHPEQVNGFWEKVNEPVYNKYGLSTVDEFVDKGVLPFDARRVDWERLLPEICEVPNRIYLPKGLCDQELQRFNLRFANMGFTLPPIGYFNPAVPGNFSEYRIN